MREGEALEHSRRLVYLLERLSADSHWAHRASGVRGALLRAIQAADGGSEPLDLDSLNRLNQAGRMLLVRAAREMGIRFP
jgi:hypothetical protein